MKRFSDALAIQNGGACNPCGIANALVNACRECIDEGVSQREDPAVRLIVHQLAYLCRVDDPAPADYSAMMDACRQHESAKETA